jgi:hypothetical protein
MTTVIVAVLAFIASGFVGPLAGLLVLVGAASAFLSLLQIAMVCAVTGLRDWARHRSRAASAGD